MPLTQDWRQEVKLFGLDPNGNISPIKVGADGSLNISIQGANNTSGMLAVDLEQSGIQLPIDVQSRRQTAIQTHNAVSVPLSGNSLGNYATSYIDCDGFDKMAITLLNDANASSKIEVYWSNDGQTNQGQDFNVSTSSNIRNAVLVDIKARYAKVLIYNMDSTAAHTISAWAYLKA